MIIPAKRDVSKANTQTGQDSKIEFVRSFVSVGMGEFLLLTTTNPGTDITGTNLL